MFFALKPNIRKPSIVFLVQQDRTYELNFFRIFDVLENGVDIRKKKQLMNWMRIFVAFSGCKLFNEKWKNILKTDLYWNKLLRISRNFRKREKEKCTRI